MWLEGGTATPLVHLRLGWAGPASPSRCGFLFGLLSFSADVGWPWFGSRLGPSTPLALLRFPIWRLFDKNPLYLVLFPAKC
jgi:hypothetical protein